MKSKRKLLSVILISIVLNLSLAGCWNSRELSSLAFITSMGFDKGDNGFLLTIQVFNPRAIASQKSVDEPSVVVYTHEGKDVIETLRKLTSQSPRRLNATHLQTVIFSEDFAKEGISYILDFFSREHQFRTDIYFAVAKGTTANKILTTSTKLETNPSNKLYSSLVYANKSLAGTNSVKVIELTNSIIADGKDPVISGIEIIGDSEGNDSIDKLKKMESDPMKIAGLAVLKKDKFAGWLSEEESKGYNYIIGNVSSTIEYLEEKSIGKISTEVTEANSKVHAYLLNGKPAIQVDIEVKENVETVKSNLDLTKEESLNKIEKLVSQQITGICNDALQKSQKEFKSDIFGFGEVIHRTYPKLWKPIKDNWSDEFAHLPVTINVTTKVQKSGTIENSYFKKEK